jgi:hypothetical protein
MNWGSGQLEHPALAEHHHPGRKHDRFAPICHSCYLAQAYMNIKAIWFQRRLDFASEKRVKDVTSYVRTRDRVRPGIHVRRDAMT